MSVVIAVRNDHDRLRRCVCSLRRWNPIAEIVIVDNESTDGTREVADAIGDIVVTWPGSVSDCHRKGAELAHGAVLVFVDADQVVGPATLTSAVGMMESCRAVLIPERPLKGWGIYMRILASERRLSEWVGLGVPRVIRSEDYFEMGGHEVGIHFGEDRAAFRKIKSVGKSRPAIYHDEVAKFRWLLRKYFRYGLLGGEGGGSGWYVHLAPPLGQFGSSELEWEDLLLAPVVAGVKVCKLGALLAGRVVAASRSRRKKG